MRPPRTPQSATRTPLNQLLGAEANVRVLRVVSHDPHPMSRSELGRRAGLETKGAHLAANRLLKQGILKRVGTGTRQQVQLEQKHPLASALRSLFRAERDHSDRIIEGLRKAAHELSSVLDAAWIQGPFATEEDRPEDAITVGVLARSDTITRAVDSLRELVTAIESAEDVTIEIKALTRADLAVSRPAELRSVEEALPLFGPPPTAFTISAKHERSMRNVLAHSDRDQEQWVLAREIAQHLINNPVKLEVAKKYIAKRLQNASSREQHDLKEWDSILHSMSPARLQKFLLDTNERAVRLRQTMPFLEILSSREREELLEKARGE